MKVARVAWWTCPSDPVPASVVPSLDNVDVTGLVKQWDVMFTSSEETITLWLDTKGKRFSFR